MACEDRHRGVGGWKQSSVWARHAHTALYLTAHPPPNPCPHSHAPVTLPLLCAALRYSKFVLREVYRLELLLKLVSTPKERFSDRYSVCGCVAVCGCVCAWKGSAIASVGAFVV